VTTDPLAALLDLSDVADSLAAARDRVDATMRHRALRRSGGPVAAEVGLADAVASAALEGHGYDLDEVRAGLVTDPVLQGALRVSRDLDRLVTVWRSAPRQALATLHLLAARGVVADGEVGRPRRDPTVAARLDALAGVLTGGSTAPALLVAAVVHGELLALRAFPGPNGVVARAAARLALLDRGLDPRGLLPLSVGHREREPEYIGAAGAFATGTADGLRSWIRHCASAALEAADRATAIADAVVA
jgi:Fic family protein